MIVLKIYWRYIARHNAAMKRRGYTGYTFTRMDYMSTVWVSPDGNEVRNVD